MNNIQPSSEDDVLVWRIRNFTESPGQNFMMDHPEFSPEEMRKRSKVRNNDRLQKKLEDFRLRYPDAN